MKLYICFDGFQNLIILTIASLQCINKKKRMVINLILPKIIDREECFFFFFKLQHYLPISILLIKDIDKIFNEKWGNYVFNQKNGPVIRVWFCFLCFESIAKIIIDHHFQTLIMTIEWSICRQKSINFIDIIL